MRNGTNNYYYYYIAITKKRILKFNFDFAQMTIEIKLLWQRIRKKHKEKEKINSVIKVGVYLSFSEFHCDEMILKFVEFCFTHHVLYLNIQISRTV